MANRILALALLAIIYVFGAIVALQPSAVVAAGVGTWVGLAAMVWLAVKTTRPLLATVFASAGAGAAIVGIGSDGAICADCEADRHADPHDGF